MSRLRSASCVSRYWRLNSRSCLPSFVHFATVHQEDTPCPRDASCRPFPADLRQPFAVTTLRGFASVGSDVIAKDLDKRTQDAMAVLKHAKLGKLRDHLQQASETAPYVSKAKLLMMIQESGAADTAEDAEQTCYALSNSGQVLLYQDKAYLRPAEVAEMVLQALPDTKEDLEQKLSVLHQELQPLEALKADVDKYAHMHDTTQYAQDDRKQQVVLRRRSNMLLWGGLAGVMAVWGVCFRLTFWELSWDVMEPITYFIGSGTGIAFYLYFLVTQREFAYREWKNQMMTTLQIEGYKQKHLDLTRYQKIKKDIERYKRYLNSDTIAADFKAKAA